MFPIADHVSKIAWHPGFVAAAGIELKNERSLELIPEKNLSKEPLRIDLFIKGDGRGNIINEIGHIFRKYNIIEYKSPEDGLTIDDFYKTLGYACFFKSLGEYVDEYPENEITFSLFRDRYPRELISYLERTGRTIEEKYKGIYYITGNVQFPAQIIVTSQLDKTHASLRILSTKATEEDVRNFIDQSSKTTNPGDRNNIDAVLQVSASANKELYERIRRESDMCQALMELMKEEIDEKIKENEERVRTENTFKVVIMIKNLMNNTGVSIETAMDNLGIPIADRSKYLARL